MRILERRPGMQATTSAEAQALVDDGLDVGLVLELFAADAAWLSPLLSASTTIFLAAESSQPSYFFDASLKRKFIGAGIRQARQGRGSPILEVAPSRGRMRTAMASTALVGAAAAIGVAAFAVIRTDDTGPSTTTPDRGTLSVSRLDIHLVQSQAHVSQILEKAATTGYISDVDLTVIESDTKVLTALAHEAPLDATQKDSAKAYVEKAVKVIADAQARPELDTQAKSALATVATAAAAAGLEGVTGIATPAPTATPDVTPTGTATATTTATPSASPTPTAPATTTPSATPTASPTATSTAENGR